MKLVSANIAAFGKLRNAEVRFDDGLNVFRAANGFGKTTLSNFIRAMLYGFTYSRTKGATDASHFQPWNCSERFGGSLTVENDGETYRIERFFGVTAKQETCTVTNVKTGKRLDWQQPGEVLLGLTAESYDRSAYFPQEAVELTSNDNLDARLANLVQNSAEDYDEVQSKLRAYKKNLRYEKGIGGRISDLERNKNELQNKLYAAKQAKRRGAEIENRLQTIAREKAALQRQIEQNDAQAETLRRQIAQAQPTEEERAAQTRYAEVSEKLARIPQQFDEDVARCDALSEQIAALANVPPSKPKRKWLWGVAAALFIAAGVMLAIFGAVALLPVAVGVSVGAVFAIAGVVLAIVGEKSAKNVEKRSSGGIDDLKNQYLTIARKYVYLETEDVEAAKRALWKAHADYLGDKQLLQTLKQFALKQHADASAAEQRLADLQTQRQALTGQMARYLTEEGQLAEERKGLCTDTAETLDELLSVDEQIAEAKYRYDVANNVTELLAQAKENLSGSYLPRLCERASQLLKEISATDLELTADRNFAVSLRERGVTKPLSEFSRGLREITLLCFRVALSELLYDGEIPFLIVDDAFVNFDENNFARATALLKKLSAHAQVIYFTCHDRTGALN